MIRIAVYTGILLTSFFLSSSLWAQKKNNMPETPTEFLEAFVSELNQARNPEARQIAQEFSTFWASGQLSTEQQLKVIRSVNRMFKKQYTVAPTMVNYSRSLISIFASDAYVKIKPEQFIGVADSCIGVLNQKRLNVFFRTLSNYVQTGYTTEHRKFFWQATQKEPELTMLTLQGEDENSYSAPIVKFTETDLIYQSRRDSTHIFETQGDFNLLSQTFLGQDGRVNWSKLGLDPDVVYCDLEKYKLNFHYGMLEADSAVLFYDSLLNEPLVGKFIDRNMGFKSVNTANYPYFKSYLGGVVIENFIPNVRYEGGFSLKGIRKIGSSYDIFEDYVPETGDPERYDNDFYSGYSSNEFYEDEEFSSEFDESSSSEWESESEEWDVEDEDFTPFEDDFASDFPSKIKKHIKAQLQIKRNEAYVMKLQGEAFVLDPEKLIAKNIASTIYLTDEDSIYHPALDLRYTVDDKTAILNKPKSGAAKSMPFTSNYHEYYLYFETIKWKLDTDNILFTAMIDQQNKVSAIESFDYFTLGRFRQFTNILPFNPIGAIYRYSLKNQGKAVFVEDILAEYKMPDKKVAFERALPSLEGSGFIKYDKKSLEINPQPKLFKWAKAARGKKDFDAIQIISQVDTGAHAVMSIQTKDVTMHGVPYFSLSDSQYVKVVPLEGEVGVQQNRDLLFAGAVASGKLNIYANDEDNRPRFNFSYDKFYIHCDSLDSIRFVLVRDPVPGYEPTPLEMALSNTVFENVTGRLFIDDPGNKSGKEQNSQYPIFDSYTPSYLYWDKYSIQGGVYTKDKMYFSVDPFVLDSLEHFDNQGLSFDGEFFSSEIFPEFRQTLAVMSDFTLGFVQKTPEEGYDVYEYKGRYWGDIILDGSGLHGVGKLDHLNATVVSDSFLFHFDSVMAVVDTFLLPSSYRVPDVKAEAAVYKWYPKDEKIMLASKNDKPISVFGGDAEFEGTMYLSDAGLVGKGALTLGQVQIRSDSIAFREKDFEAKVSEFAVIDSINKDEVHFAAKNVNVEFDSWRNEFRFESNDQGRTMANFPMHQYLTTLVKGDFDPNSGDLKLSSTAKSDTIRDYMISYAIPGDSVKLVAKNARYSVKTRDIEILDVPAIEVADALITPGADQIVIHQEGKIEELSGATIEADKESKYHKIYDATVNIYSASNYQGSGKYDYIKVNGNPQFINFEQIEVNYANHTFATGEIKEDQNFYLTDRILFKGTVELDASKKYLSFEGDVQIESENPVFKGEWFQLPKTTVNPDSVFIPIPSVLTNDEGELLAIGLNYINEYHNFYSTFLQAKEAEDDIEILSASGGLTLDRKTQQFRIGSEARLKNQTYVGSVVSFDDINNVITSQGYLDFKSNFNEKILQMEMAGSWKDNISTKTLSTDLMIGLNMDVIPEEPMTSLVQTVQYLITSNKDIDFLQRDMIAHVAALLDKFKTTDKETRKFEKTVKEAMVYTDIDLAERLGYTLLLSGVDFKYDEEKQAFWSNSEVGLIGLGGQTVNKVVSSMIVYQFGEVQPTGEVLQDQLDIYLELDEFNWIYFSYANDVLKTYSSFYADFNNPLRDIVAKRKNNDGPRFDLSNEDEVAQFKQEFIKNFIKE